ncbi:MAG TPA: sialidase family protein [Candidatus Hydrogenedentes bacterium]|nr:sialidase family protein [Candidatus Hydrogenedentota bacterium]
MQPGRLLMLLACLSTGIQLSHAMTVSVDPPNANGTTIFETLHDASVYLSLYNASIEGNGIADRIEVKVNQLVEDEGVCGYDWGDYLVIEGDGDGDGIPCTVVVGNDGDFKGTDYHHFFVLDTTSTYTTPWNQRLEIKNFVMIPKYIGASQVPSQVYGVFTSIWNSHQYNKGSILFDNVVITGSLYGDTVADPFTDYRSVATRWALPFYLTARGDQTAVRYTRYDFRNTIVAQTLGLGYNSAVLQSDGDDQLVHLGPGFASLYCEGYNLVKIRYYAKLAGLEVAGTRENRNLFYGNETNAEMLCFEIASASYTKGFSRIAYTDMIGNTAESLVKSNGGLSLIERCLVAENAAMDGAFELNKPSQAVTPMLKVRDSTFFDMAAGENIAHFRSGGFYTSQSFEDESEGLGFTTNISSGPRTATFEEGIFAGNGVDHDYVAIYPLHASLPSPLMTDGDSVLSSVSNIDGTQYVVGEDSGAIISSPGTFIMTFDPLDISDVEEIRVTLAAAAPRTNTYPNNGSYLSDLSVWIIVDGASPVEIGRFRGDQADDYTTNMALDADMDGVGESTQLTDVFQDFSFTSAVSGESLQVQIRLTSDQNAEEICFDNVRIGATRLSGVANYVFENVIFAAGDGDTLMDPGSSDIAFDMSSSVKLRRCVLPESGNWRLRGPYGAQFPPEAEAVVGWASLVPIDSRITFEACSNLDPDFTSDDLSDFPLPGNVSAWLDEKITLAGCSYLAPENTNLPMDLPNDQIVMGALKDDSEPVDTSLWRVTPVAQSNQVVWASSDENHIFGENPGLAICASGRLVATMDYLTTSSAMGYVYTSDDGGDTWTLRAVYPFTQGRPFVADSSLYILGVRGHDLAIIRSTDSGTSWGEATYLTGGGDWRGAASNVYYDDGMVYLVMDKHLERGLGSAPDRVADIAPVLMRADVEDDLTNVANWTFASELAYVDVIDDDVDLEDFGVPYYPAFAPNTYTAATGRVCQPNGWLEANVTRITDPNHYWYDAAGDTLHLILRAHTGGAGYAALLKVVENSNGTMTTSLEQAPSGVDTTYLPTPGGQMKSHIVYDDQLDLYWMLSTQNTDSMTTADELPTTRAGLPSNERRRLALYFSRNLVDWCFAALVAAGPAETASRHYASMVIDGEDLHVLSRSGNLEANSAEECNLITFHTVRDFRRLAGYYLGERGVASDLPTTPTADTWCVRPLADAYQTLWHSGRPLVDHAFSPGITKTSTGRLIATADSAGIYVSDDHGATWEFRFEPIMSLARPFEAGGNVYLLGTRSGDINVMASEDDGDHWSTFGTAITSGQEWHQAPSNVLFSGNNVYLVMERRVPDELSGGWYVSELAPVLMRANVNDDLTAASSWTYASEIPFYDEIDDAALNHLGIPFYDGFYPNSITLAPGRVFYPAGWLETHVVKFEDSSHEWYDPEGNTFHLFARTHTGRSNLACVMKVVENQDGTMTTSAQTAPSGVKTHYLPMPGGHIKFHVLYDEVSQLYWLVSSQATDSMTRAELLPEDRVDLPTNERHRLQLHFSKNMVDWCFAGLVAVGEDNRSARHYCSMVIDGDDLLILSRSGDECAESAHNVNMITLHKIESFRELAYLDDAYGIPDQTFTTTIQVSEAQSFESEMTGLGFVNNISPNSNRVMATFETNFAETYFIGKGYWAPRDYIALWPLHTASPTNPTLFYDDDDTLANLSNIHGDNCVVVEDSRTGEAGGDDDFLLMTFEPVDITGDDEISVTIAVAAPRGTDAYANTAADTTDLSVWIIVDDGDPVEIGSFCGDVWNDSTTNLALDMDMDGVGEGTALTSTLQDFTFTYPVSGDELVVMVRAESRQNNQEIVFDNVRVKSVTVRPTP